MGIFANALVIVMGSLFGGKLRRNKPAANHNTLGIGIMVLSLVGFLENIYHIEETGISSKDLLLVLAAFFIGSKIGEWIRLDERLSNLAKTKDATVNAVIDTTLFFGVGGLQISGPIALALNGDNSQLLIKSFVDMPFALAFGATYGKCVGLSALPVAAVQILIVLAAYLSASFFTPDMTMQLCAVGYIVLFFTGFNLISPSKFKINNINMLPGIFLVILFQIILNFTEIWL